MAFLLKNKTDKLSYQMRDGIGKDKKLKTYNSEIYTYYENEPIIDLSNANYYDFIKVSSFEDAKEKLLSIGQTKISDGLGNILDLDKPTIIEKIKEAVGLESKKIEVSSHEAPIAVVEEQVAVSSPVPQRQIVKHAGRPKSKGKK
jgi:hypothetical protein